jgi:hypothetical protein
MSKDEAERVETARLAINMVIEVNAVAAQIFRQAGLPTAGIVDRLARYAEEARDLTLPEFHAAREELQS